MKKKPQQTTQHQTQSTNKAKQNNLNENKPKQTKNKNKEHKTPKPFIPNQQEYAPPQSPPNWGKQTLLTLKHLYQTHKKQTTKTLKLENKHTKTPFCHVQKQPTIFHKFFFNLHILLQLLCLAENTTKIMF